VDGPVTLLSDEIYGLCRVLANDSRFPLEAGAIGSKMYRAAVRPARACDWLGGSMTSKILTLASEFRELASKWQTLSIYEKFEQLVVAVLTTVIALIIAFATWQLLFHTLNLVESHLVSPADSQIFQGLFGTVLTVLIALEFKHTLLD
jgi:Phosphate-starvation-inducible E family